MSPENLHRWEEFVGSEEPMRTPQQLMMRSASPDDYVDAAIIGGVSVADILAGKVSEAQIPDDVINAFHLQYPHQPGFVEAVLRLKGHPDAIRGLVSGVKGKLFETDYLHWLNDGHLPPGFTADLAPDPHQPIWDIVVHDPSGAVDQLLQLKAAQSIAYVRDAINANPSVDVVVPHDLYEKFASDPTLAGHLVDGHQDLTTLGSHVDVAVSHAADATAHFIAPGLVMAWVVAQKYSEYRKGRISMEQALSDVTRRGILAVISSIVYFGTATATGSTLIGIPIAMGTRIIGGQALHNWQRRNFLGNGIDQIKQSRLKIEGLLVGPLAS